MKQIRIVAIGLLAVAAVAVSPPAARADTTTPGIVGSSHDFTANTNFWVNGATYVPNNDVCEECHAIHKAGGSSSAYRNAGPLWNHTGSGSPPTYTPFTSPALAAAGITGNQPGWASLACLSCHDGIIAINELGGKAPSTPITMASVASWAQITTGAGGIDLSSTHPIGFSYDTAQTANPSGLNPSSTAISATGGAGAAGADNGSTISKLLLFNETTVGGTANMVECASCHDIHQRKGNSGLASASPLGHRDSVTIGSSTSVQPLCLTCHIK
jgi:hypothetical protein